MRRQHMERRIISATSLSLVVIMILLASSYTATLSCPPGFLTTSNKLCVLRVEKSVDYCEANRICYTEGLRRGLRVFLMGRNVNILGTGVLDVVFRFYGIHALLQGVESLQPSWMYSDPGCSSCVSLRGTSVWKDGEPNGRGRERVVMCNYKGCVDVAQHNATGPFVCEVSNYPMPSRWTATRYLTDWPVKLADPFMSDHQNQGCFRILKLSSILLCSLKCQITDVCRAFYYNSQEGHCSLTFYVDSRLPKSMEIVQGTWVRFAKPDY
ncbi:uncharacterized protein DEA37_0009439 [Paragonimus westermani]|uniref:Apple domain-containing protein n=1 Tax=Paragonimus westermani TaxID=34504 RepID=A0A5J4NBI8_9TREM|nr:uncharacterized protein DEA37_0009439 [Paragonimus westermani]